jgi:hypothetical protein
MKADSNMATELTRRELARTAEAALAGALGIPRAKAQTNITAADVVERIKAKLAGEDVTWGPSVFDGFHLGDPRISVSGVAATFEPTLDLLQRALAAKKTS